jgi:hypothetical protein
MRCPVCRAEVSEGPQCRRCRADLSLLFRLEEQRRQALVLAYQCASQGDWRRAGALAEGVDTLRSDRDSQRLRAVVALGSGDFARAWRTYRRLKEEPVANTDGRG